MAGTAPPRLSKEQKAKLRDPRRVIALLVAGAVVRQKRGQQS
jgi:hypothetical protein